MANVQRWLALAIIDGQERVCAEDELASRAVQTARDMLNGAYTFHPNIQEMVDGVVAVSQTEARRRHAPAYREWQSIQKEYQDAVFADGGAT